jgi:long-subunit fatty acid transport protein
MRTAVALIALATSAHAGGLTLPTRGMHSTERAGALVAGADDADALFLDPAGLARIAGDGQRSLLFDVGYLYEPEQFTAPNAGTANNQQPGTAQFTVAGALGIGDRLVIAGGVTTLSAGVHHFDNTGVQRFASTDVAGTQYVTVAVGAAYVMAPRLRVGATLQDTVSMLDWSLVASACPGTTTCAAGDANYDLPLHLTQNDYIAPSGSIGVQYDALAELTVGATVQAPTKISSQGTLIVTPPASPTFTGMPVTGTNATTSFWLPPSVRAGVELRHHTDSFSVRVEAAVDVELWGIHDAITIAPDGIAIGAMPLKPMTIVRDYHTSVAPSVGGELHIGEVRIAAGIGYETSAAPTSTVSTLTIDAPKWLFGLGGGYSADGWDLGVAAGLAQLSKVTVDAPAVSVLAPLRDSSAPPTYINAGTYGAYDLTVGLRGSRRF